MLEATEEESDQPLTPLLDYGCSQWRASSRHAADLYDSGVKLWKKEDLVDIENQLAQSIVTEIFTVRRFDGSIIRIKNPMFGVQRPIWKPFVKFQDFWHLVRTKPDGPPEIYLCTYLIDWANQAIRNYEGPVENVQGLFEDTRTKWNSSETCQAFALQCHDFLGGGSNNAKKVTKIVCFGLGDLNFKPPDWWREQNDSLPEGEREPEKSVIEGSLTHHAIALTMADIARSYVQNRDIRVRLLTQDPAYCPESRKILQEIGFAVVGNYGAGGFAELDDETLVFSAFAAAPVKQIIADFARPAIIICNRITGGMVFGKPGKPYSDPESPRTKQMWEGYKAWSFPNPSADVKLEGSLKQLAIYVRSGE